MKRKTIDPLVVLDRAFRELVPEAERATNPGLTEPVRDEPLDVLRSLVDDGGNEAPASIGQPPVTSRPASSSQAAEALHLDPIETLRRLEKTLGPLNTDQSATNEAAHASPHAHADALQALMDLEKEESALWAVSAESEDDPSGEADAEETAAEGVSPRERSNTSVGRMTASPMIPPAAAVNPEPPREFASASPVREFAPYHPKNPGGVFPPPPRSTKSRRAPSLRPEAQATAQDAGVAARAAFYKARQELGEGAALDEIISRACIGLDRKAQEILFEIQLKILLGNS